MKHTAKALGIFLPYVSAEMLTIAACTNVDLSKEFKTPRANVQEERFIAVREEPNLHIVYYQKDVPDEMRTWQHPCRHGVKESLLEWTCCAPTRGARTHNIMSTESKLPWCETREQGLLMFALLANGVQDHKRPKVSYRLKVNEFTDFDNQK